jgi:diphthine synthase
LGNRAVWSSPPVPAQIVAGTLQELLQVDFGAPLHSFVLPGKMHILEGEMLETFAVNREAFKQHAVIQQ